MGKCVWKKSGSGVKCEYCRTTRRSARVRTCSSPDAPEPIAHGFPYFIDLIGGKYLWGCRACNWTTQTPTDEQPDHRCGQGECKYKGAEKGTVKVECCSGVEKLLTAHECAVHGRCLPGFVRHDSAIAKWNERKPESDIYKLCCICSERED